MPGITAHMRRYIVVLGVLLTLLVPVVAQARSYEVGPVHIDATVRTDGSLAVTESRTFAFDGAFGGVFWEVPRSTYEGHVVDATIVSVGVLQNGSLQAFVQDDSGEPGTYELSEESDALLLKLCSPAEDETVTFQVRYETGPLATCWSDTAELYWQYVPADEDAEVEWHNVTAVIHLPVPTGEPVNPGENVRAWAHGPLDGDVSFAGNDVVCYSPGVGTAEYLEARVAFPPSWLSEVQARDEAHLDTMLAEEDAWAKEANAARRRARRLVYGIPGLMALIAILSVVVAKLNRRFRKGKTPKAQFRDTYFREVPTDDHPAVLGMLYRDGQLDGKDFSATLMRLAEQGRISLDTVSREEKGRLGRTKQKREWRILLRGSTKTSRLRRHGETGGANIDNQALRFLKDVVACEHGLPVDEQLRGPAGEPPVLMRFFARTAQEHPSDYERGYNWWADAVRSAYDKRGFSEQLGDSLFMAVLGLGDIALFVILGIVGMLVGSPTHLLCGGLVLLFGAGIYVILTDDDAPRIAFSQEAAEIKAKLEALRRWLREFTRLEEAIPTDVALWNELLVMATELDVAGDVIRQLKVAAPQVLADPGLSAYDWCADRDDEGLEAPVRLVATEVAHGHSTSSGSSSHSVSSSSLASSRDSSSSGSGGGFSGGGGGGYSGGGRGGAF